MQIEVNLSEEQQKALLTYYKTIGGYVQTVVENRANRIMNDLVRDYAKGKFEVVGVTVSEQVVIDNKLANKIVVQPDQIPEEVKKIIVRRAKIKTAVEKIAEQEAEFKEIKK